MVSLGSYANEGCDYKSYLFAFACLRQVPSENFRWSVVVWQ